MSAASGLSGQMDTRLLKVEKALLAHLVRQPVDTQCPTHSRAGGLSTRHKPCLHKMRPAIRLRRHRDLQCG